MAKNPKKITDIARINQAFILSTHNHDLSESKGVYPIMSSVVPNTPSLSEFRPSAPENGEALDYWHTCCGANTVPFWRDFDLLEISNVVTHSIFLKRQAEDNWTATLFGSELVTRFGADLTGINILEILEPATRIDAAARLKRLSEGPAIVRSVNKMMSAMGVPLIVEWLLLPFADDDEQVNHCLMMITGLDYSIPDGQLMTGDTVGRTVLEVDFVDLNAASALKRAG